jgi:hypothetical protein
LQGPRTGVTGISGRVLDLEGNPQAGLYVAAYPANGNLLFQMHILRLMTKFIAKTDDNGRFSIMLDGGGIGRFWGRRLTTRNVTVCMRETSTTA